jgi:hypothetical protein
MRGFFENYLRHIKVGSLKARVSKPACETPFTVAERDRQRGYYLTEFSKNPSSSGSWRGTGGEVETHLRLLAP